MSNTSSRWCSFCGVRPVLAALGFFGFADQPRGFWRSAAWFEWVVRPAQVKTIYGFKIDRIKVGDDFEPLAIVE